MVSKGPPAPQRSELQAPSSVSELPLWALRRSEGQRRPKSDGVPAGEGSPDLRDGGFPEHLHKTEIG